MRRLARSAIAVALAFGAGVAAGGAVAAHAAVPSPRVVVDDFEDVSGWTAHPADGVELVIGQDAGVHGRALRLDYRFVRGGGYAVARKTFDLPLPPDYRFRWAVRGEGSRQNLEFKLIDSTGANVWWNNRRDFAFPGRWDSLATKKRKIEFAWGPAGGGTLGRVAAIEFAITAGSGGSGTVWLDDLVLEPLPPPIDPPPVPSLNVGSRVIEVDLRTDREFSGLAITWAPGRAVPDYVVDLADSDGRFTGAKREVRGADGGVDLLHFPDAEAHYVRIRTLDPALSLEDAVTTFEVLPPTWAPTVNDFFARVAAGAPPGTYPRGIVGEQPYWTAIGADRDRVEALVDEDGRIEPWKQGPSLEAFLRVGERLWTWRDGSHAQRLVDGDLPMPIVEWTAGDLRLTTTAFVSGDSGAALLQARYRLENRGRARVRGALGLALRPFQVNPPPQFLNTTGGAARVAALGWSDDGALVADDHPPLSLYPAPDRRGVATFDQGDAVAAFFARGRVPVESRVVDPFGHASGLAVYDFDLPPGAAREIEAAATMAPGKALALRPFQFDRALELTAARWRKRRGDLVIELPPSGREALETFRAQLGWLRVTRDGAAVQPGARSYERSWIRDGALSSSAMLRVGEADIARDFADWFAPFVPEDGAVPCCVDARGPDPTPEHDSHGEFIFLVAEVLRYTGDEAAARRLWPAVRRAAGHIEFLRQQRRTPDWRAPGNAHFFGLLPPSISHEGYSAKAMHSYWDDFFALRGLTDAAWLAARLGHTADAETLAARRNGFAGDLAASIRAAMQVHGIDWIPGAADLGDFDATSTTIALDPVAAGPVLPPGALERTFDRYWDFFTRRRDGVEPWEAYTPYELRTIGALVRLGHRERAHQALDWFLLDRRPAGFRHWAEVVSSEPRTPRFLGDMPHTWVGTDYVRSFVDLFAYVEAPAPGDSALVVAAGVRPEWVAEAPGVRVRDLPTPFGRLGYRMALAGSRLVVDIDAGSGIPPGGFRIRPPDGGRPWRRARLGRATLPLRADGSVLVREAPARVVFSRD